LLIVVAAFTSVAERLRIPYPVAVVLGGSVLGFVPGLPQITLNPDLVFLFFVPPLIYASALFSSVRDFRANFHQISLHAFGLVLLTMCAVAVVAHTAIDGLTWPAAFALGAILSPTDALAATTIAKHLAIPQRVVTILEGESLINDATAMVIFRVAVGAVVMGTFSVWQTGLEFVAGSVLAVVLGLAVGWTLVRARRYLIGDSPVLQNTIALLTPFIAYLPAENFPISGIHVSGILAVVTTGLYTGWHASYLVSPSTRLRGYAIWEMVDFLLNGLAFILLGLQFQSILEGLSEWPVLVLVLYAGLISLTVILVRIAWVFAVNYIPQFVGHRVRERNSPSSEQVWLTAWIGNRGVISLAAALSLPLFTYTGTPFPQRDLLIFLTFCVILATLVFQSLTLPALVHLLHSEDEETVKQEENKARVEISHAALTRIEELRNEDWVDEDMAERLQEYYDYRQRRFAARVDSDAAENGDEGEDYEEYSAAYKRFLRELLQAQRRALVRLHREGQISDEAMRQVEYDIDLEEARLE
jgi:monovalent cation/hydrogen antiporter